MKESKGDRLLELSLYVLGLCLFFAYFFIDLNEWQDYSLVYIFCGFFFHLALLKVISKKQKRKFDYVVPILSLGISIPSGYAFDYIVKAIIRILRGLDIQLALLLLIIVFCFSVGVLSTIFVWIGLVFWEELLFEKRK